MIIFNFLIWKLDVDSASRLLSRAKGLCSVVVVEIQGIKSSFLFRRALRVESAPAKSRAAL